MKALSPTEREKILREALEFYANGNHDHCLYGRMDWVVERQKLYDKGFRKIAEDGRGAETFVEDGRLAQAALDATYVDEVEEKSE